MSNTRTTSTVLLATAVLAISVAQGWATCIKPPASEATISQFRANPQGLVAPNADTRTIEATTRDIAGTNAALAADFIWVAQSTTPRFQTAIAAGLAQAAVACSTVDQQAAQLIQQAVAGFQDGQFQAAFAAVAGDLSTAATEAATAFATSSVGSVVVVNPNRAAGSTLTRGGGGFSALLQLSAPGASSPTGSSATTGPSATAAGAVSPTR